MSLKDVLLTQDNNILFKGDLYLYQRSQIITALLYFIVPFIVALMIADRFWGIISLTVFLILLISVLIHFKTDEKMILFKENEIIIQKGSVILARYTYNDVKKIKFIRLPKHGNTFTVWTVGSKKYAFTPHFNWNDLITHSQERNEKVQVKKYDAYLD